MKVMHKGRWVESVWVVDTGTIEYRFDTMRAAILWRNQHAPKANVRMIDDPI